jgi:hypothetical protein
VGTRLIATAGSPEKRALAHGKSVLIDDRQPD